MLTKNDFFNLLTTLDFDMNCFLMRRDWGLLSDSVIKTPQFSQEAIINMVLWCWAYFFLPIHSHEDVIEYLLPFPWWVYTLLFISMRMGYYSYLYNVYDQISANCWFFLLFLHHIYLCLTLKVSLASWSLTGLESEPAALKSSWLNWQHNLIWQWNNE